MRYGFNVSIRSLMQFIILLALQLVLFKEVWQILVIPPITTGVLMLNLGLFFLLVRPPVLEPRIIGMLLGGVMAVVAIVIMFVLMFASNGQNTRWAPPNPRGRSGPVGPIGTLVDHPLVRWLMSLPDQQTLAARVLGFISDNILVIEMIFLNLLGVALIWAGGRLENRFRDRWIRARAPGLTGLPPLDDRAATPL